MDWPKHTQPIKYIYILYIKYNIYIYCILSCNLSIKGGTPEPLRPQNRFHFVLRIFQTRLKRHLQYLSLAFGFLFTILKTYHLDF